MKALLLLLFIAAGIPLSAKAQDTASHPRFTPVDMDQINAALAPDKAPGAYNKLLDRFIRCDSSLDVVDYRFLYYGYVYQGGYQLYPKENKKKINAALKAKKYELASLICDTVLARSPLCLSANYYKALAIYLAHPEGPDYHRYRDRFKGLVAAILSSGTGLNCSAGFKVITPSDENAFIYLVLNIANCKGQSFTGNCDLLQVEPSKLWSNEGIYFDATEILKKEAAEPPPPKGNSIKK